MALGFAAIVLGGSLDLSANAKLEAATPPASVSAPSIIKDYMRTQPPYEETAYLRWLRFQLRAIGADSGPAVRYPVGGQFDVAQYSNMDDMLGAGAPR